MSVKLISKTPQIEETIVEIARVSSSRKNKREKPEGLINYLIKNKHWSPFEHGYLTFEITTSKAIAIQFLRHKSCTFQEFSQRYQDVNLLGDVFQPIELRMQAQNNRQSSTDVIEEEALRRKVDDHLKATLELYIELLAEGVARETARFVLPMCTSTKLHMTGNVRSWIHFVQLRDDEHAQKEARLLAKEIKSILIEELPIISNALNWGDAEV